MRAFVIAAALIASLLAVPIMARAGQMPPEFVGRWGVLCDYKPDRDYHTLINLDLTDECKADPECVKRNRPKNFARNWRYFRRI
jgi:hypothetical protein